MEVKDITKTVLFAVTNPELLTVDFTKLEQKAAENRKARDLANPGKPEPESAELRRLRKELFNVTQNAHCYETRVNEGVASVREFEKRINDMLRQAKDAAAKGNLRGEDSYRHQADLLESELLDARELFTKNQRYNLNAVHALKNWQAEHGARLEELKKIA